MADEATERRRWQLGRELRKARVDAGMTQSVAAKVLDCRQGKINKIEKTLVAVNMAELNKLLDAYQVAAKKAAELRELAADDGHRSRPKSEPRSLAFRKLSDLELDATEILCWHCEGIPGPLQSELYMLRQFHADAEPTSEVVQLIRQRVARTRIFTAEDPPLYRVVLSESSLHRMPGGRSPEMTLDQVEHLSTAIRNHEQLTLQILPFDAPIRYVHTDFVIVRFDGDEDDFTYVEYPGDARIIKDITEFEKHWRELRDAALSPDDSIKFLDRFAEETRAKWHAEVTTGQQPYAPGD